MDSFTSMKFMWNGGNVRRYHTFLTTQTDTVGHHSYNVACIIMHLRPDASAALLRAALKHDMAEHQTGDMPSPAKDELPDYRLNTGEDQSFREAFGEYEASVAKMHGVQLEEDLTEEEAWVLKFADNMDGMRFCLQERTVGNRLLDVAFENFRGYAALMLYGRARPGQVVGIHHPPAQPQDCELFIHVVGEWYNVTGK